jgi:hypothetical protein
MHAVSQRQLADRRAVPFTTAAPRQFCSAYQQENRCHTITPLSLPSQACEHRSHRARSRLRAKKIHRISCCGQIEVGARAWRRESGSAAAWRPRDARVSSTTSVKNGRARTYSRGRETGLYMGWRGMSCGQRSLTPNSALHDHPAAAELLADGSAQWRMYHCTTTALSQVDAEKECTRYVESTLSDLHIS